MAHNINLVFTAEALAMYTVLDCFILDNKHYTIISDSQSVLRALKNVHNKSPKIIIMVNNKLSQIVEIVKSVQLIWS